jgi:hypothetical protein
MWNLVFHLLRTILPFRHLSRVVSELMLSIRQGSARKRYDHEEAKVELSELGMRRGNSPSDVGRDSKHIRNGV